MTSPVRDQSAAEGLGSPARGVCEAILARARRELPEAAFNLWVADLGAGELRANVVELLVPNAYVKNWLAAHHTELMSSAAREVLGSDVRVRIRVRRPRREAEPGGKAEAVRPPTGDVPGAEARSGRATARRQHPTLDDALGQSPFPDRYTFDTFVAGPSNKFAHAAALAVAEAPPSKAYNPVFIYGGVGLGKTHLLFAIANHTWQLAPHTRIRYATSESFMTEFIKSVREGKGYLFQRQYRDVDV